jgi:glycosyltransferase involved in cell wall biosynthesis
VKTSLDPGIGSSGRSPRLPTETMTSVFFMYRDAPQRRAALATEPGSGERYALYGLDQLPESDISTRHNLERHGPPPAWARVGGGAIKRVLEHAGGYGGDFATVLSSLRRANRADVVFSTVDTVGIPLMLLKHAGLLRPPLVYAAIGLPERLERLRNERMRRLYAAALGSSAVVFAYSEHEADVLRAWLDRYDRRVPVEFVPFGVDTSFFRPAADAPTVDIVSVGADPHRDYELLLRVAATMPEVSFLLVTTGERARALPPLPANVTVETDLPFGEMRRRLALARVVALPVRENSYSGATTVLLQALALGKPVVVTKTQAIATGYSLTDRQNCRLVTPGDEATFTAALAETLEDDAVAAALGKGARETAERDLGWDRYAGRIERLLLDAAGKTVSP